MDRPPTTVLLPTTEWTSACDDVAGQLGPGDRLLVICDSERDPVARRESIPEGVEVVVAGEPEGCSGKANAIDAGMERAATERIVWTDDDFRRPDDWLDALHEDYEAHGPVSEVPIFVGRDPLAVLLEPVYAFGGTFLTWVADNAWAGAVAFERSDLDEAALRRDLRRAVSDDGTLDRHLDVTTLKRGRAVPIGGSLRETLERHVRFVKLMRFHAPALAATTVVAAVLGAAVSLLSPLGSFAIVTAFFAAIYAAFGIRRWTILLAYPSVVLSAPLMGYALARRTFVWGGRRYRWRGLFDVEVVE